MGMVTGIALVVVTAAAWGVITDRSAGGSDQLAGSKVPPSWQRPVVSGQGLTKRVGVRIVHVAVSGEGGLLDLRFQVLDPSIAADIHDPTTPPALVDEGTGLVANSLLMGHAHTAPFNPGETYYLIFEDPGNVIQRGDTVSVLLGDAQVEHVLVR